MVFVAFSFLHTVPVHEKSYRQMDLNDGDDHCACNTKSSYTAEKTDDKAESAKELRQYADCGEDCGDAESSCHEMHGSTKTIATKPAECDLCAVNKENDSENQTADGNRCVICGCQYWLHTDLREKLCNRVRDAVTECKLDLLSALGNWLLLR